MRQSQLFYKTTKESPKDAKSVSHKLLCRAGYVNQLMAGVYTYMPLGFRVLKKIEAIIVRNMESEPINGQEILMPSLTPKENWQKTGRWDNFDALFKLRGFGEKDYGLAPTHEEVVSPLAKNIVFSYKDLPFYLFQIQNKFRNEARAKSGILRTREFLMKDLYSFHTDEEDLNRYYDKMIDRYLKIFKEVGIRKDGVLKITYPTLASGGTFSKYSHEFQTVTSSGEDIIFICQKCQYAINKEIKEETNVCPHCDKKTEFKEEKAVEVGNIFKLGTKFSVPFDLKFRDKEGKELPVLMGCYGIGLGRLMGAIVEVNNDDRGIIWPESVAPFGIHLIQLENSKKVREKAEKIYEMLGSDVLFDDRENMTFGEKFAEADLIGIPLRIIVSEKTLKSRSVELKRRDEDKSKMVKINNLENICGIRP